MRKKVPWGRMKRDLAHSCISLNVLRVSIVPRGLL
jgi:hypothetical protein